MAWGHSLRRPSLLLLHLWLTLVSPCAGYPRTERAIWLMFMLTWGQMCGSKPFFQTLHFVSCTRWHVACQSSNKRCVRRPLGLRLLLFGDVRASTCQNQLLTCDMPSHSIVLHDCDDLLECSQRVKSGVASLHRLLSCQRNTGTTCSSALFSKRFGSLGVASPAKWARYHLYMEGLSTSSGIMQAEVRSAGRKATARTQQVRSAPSSQPCAEQQLVLLPRLAWTALWSIKRRLAHLRARGLPPPSGHEKVCVVRLAKMRSPGRRPFPDWQGRVARSQLTRCL